MKLERDPRHLVALKTIVFLILLQAIPAYAQQKTSGDGDWTEVIRKAMPAVVSITACDASGSSCKGGTGFIVQSNGVIVTNYHVIKGTSMARVTTKAGEKFDVKGVIDFDSDAGQDFAILRIAAADLPTLPLGNSNDLELGEAVLAIGDPLGLEGSVSSGILSSKAREVPKEFFEHQGLNEKKEGTWIQTTAPISHGNSGGPLLNRRGQVIGMMTWSWSAVDPSAQNLNFASPVNYVRGSLDLGLTVKYALPQLAQAQEELDKRLAKAQEEAIEKYFTPYDDPTAVFKIRRPADWKVTRTETTLGNGSREIKTLFNPENAALAEINGYLSEGMLIDIVVPPSGSYFTQDVLNDSLNKFAESVLRSNPGFDLKTTGLSMIHDIPAKVYTVDGKSPRLSKPERDIFYLFGNQKAVVLINLVEPESGIENLDRLAEYCAKSFQISSTYTAPADSLPSDNGNSFQQNSNSATGKTIEMNFKSGLYDDVIKLAPAYLQTNPNSPEANAYLGLALLAKRDVDNAVVYLEKAISLGQQISLPVLRLRQPLIGHALENAIVTISAGGIVVTSGNSNFTGSFSSLSTSTLTNYNNQCYVASLQGNFIETSGKSEKTKQGNKTFNMFPPNSGLRPVQQGNMVINYAVCDTQSLNTTAIIKLIARLAARTP